MQANHSMFYQAVRRGALAFDNDSYSNVTASYTCWFTGKVSDFVGNRSVNHQEISDAAQYCRFEFSVFIMLALFALTVCLMPCFFVSRSHSSVSPSP